MKHTIYLALIALSFGAIAQQNPTNNTPIPNSSNNIKAQTLKQVQGDGTSKQPKKIPLSCDSGIFV